MFLISHLILLNLSDYVQILRLIFVKITLFPLTDNTFAQGSHTFSHQQDKVSYSLYFFIIRFHMPMIIRDLEWP
jgi:hypothetical protein